MVYAIQKPRVKCAAYAAFIWTMLIQAQAHDSKIKVVSALTSNIFDTKYPDFPHNPGL
jgi:hypothetical protein